MRSAAYSNAGIAAHGKRLPLVCALGAAFAVCAALGLASAIRCQAPSQPGSGNGTTGMSGIQGANAGRGGFGRNSMGTLPTDEDNYDPMMAERRMRALNIERQKQMVSDAAKLLKLAQELNGEVASANQGAFTPEQLHKIAEIEKLARSVKERMSSAVGETPTALPPPTLVYPVH